MSRGEKKIKFRDPYILGFPISPCATSLEEKFLGNKKGFLCVIVQHKLNQTSKENGVSYVLLYCNIVDNNLIMVCCPSCNSILTYRV